MTTKKPTRIWLDCDPGHDDVIAILLASYDENIELIGVSTVGGNQTLELTTKNASRFLHFIGRDDIIVYPGAAKPLVRPELICAEIHGESGLDGFDFEDANNLICSTKPAINAIADAALSSDEPITIVATGSLTNIALLLSVYPQLLNPKNSSEKPKIDKIIIMGGAIGIGNTHPAAEFNIQVDPEAAQIVVEMCSLRQCLYMVPLEVTHTALFTNKERLELENRVIATTSCPVSKMLLALLAFFTATYQEQFNFPFPPVHDPCAVLCAAYPEYFENKLCHVHVETMGRSAGRTNCDILNFLKLQPTTQVSTKMDVDKFWEHTIAAIDRASERIKLLKE